jgi:hypothetical protein
MEQQLQEQQRSARQVTAQTEQGSTLLTRHGVVRKDYVSEVKALMAHLEQQQLLDALSQSELEESVALKKKLIAVKKIVNGSKRS